MRGGKLHSSLCNGSTSHIMWCRLFLVFLVGAASAEHFQAWKTDTEYEYNIRGRTLAALHDSSDQYSGIVLRARLTVQPKSEDTLEARVSKAQYAQIHTKLPDGWKSEIPDSMLDLKQFPMSEKVFEIKMKHGTVRDMIVDKDVPNWEVNVLKSIVSQLQVDTQGENLMASRYNQEPEEDRVSAMYKTMEDSVGGKCEVLYDISNLPEFVSRSRPELLPMPHLRGDGEIIEIVKTKNFSNCEQRMSHHFGITGSNKWEPGTNNGKFMSRSSVSRIIITGDLKTFTIQSSVTTNKVIMSPSLHENEKGMVSSRVNVTLVKMGPVSSGPWSTPANPESAGSLVYSFNSPFSKIGEERRASSSALESHTSEERRSRYLSDMFRHKDDDSSTSASSRSANSLESDEDHSYLQPKPTLNEAPSTPLLPFFIGYGGKSIDRSNDFDTVSATKTLASQIGSDLQDPNSITDEQTLEKFTILASLIRTMNTEQIAEVEREVYQSNNQIDPHDESQSVRRNTWVAFRDAVAQAGTGPALVTIKNWIKETKVLSHEAASIVGSLSKTARTPTPEYMEAFFELATMPETANERFLNSTAIITFAELIRYSQVNHDSAHNRYPVHSFGRLSPKHNQAIFNKYIPYMAEQLSSSIEKRELAKSHVFIRALGNVAHPNILAVFEPYLEGKKPASTFQRTLMVFSMNKLAALRPRLARGVFYRMYQNTAEAHEVRCAAVVFLMSTNPPESMLQRMAEFTNYDHSKHVSAAVKSAIESASKLKTRESQDLATKARNVLSLLNKESYGAEYSMNYFLDNAIEEMNIAYRSQVAYIGSEDSFMPQAFYASMKMIYGDFKAPKPELAAMVSSVKELYNEIRKQFMENSKEPRENSQNIQFSPENIAKLLKIRGDESDDLEGAFWMKTKYHNNFMSFDKESLRGFPELLSRVAASLKDGRSFNMAKLESYDLTLSFPMESGFPFLYTMKVPALLKLSGNMRGGENPSGVDGYMDLRFVYSVQVQARLGFVTPFEHQQYMAGVNKNFQAYAPIRAEFTYNQSDKRVTLKMRPIEQSQKYKLLHYSVVPFTAQHDILHITPITMDKRTHKLKNSEPWTRSVDIGSRTRGLNIKFEAEYDESSAAEAKWDWDLVSKTAFFFAEDKIRPSRTEMTLIPNPSSEQSVLLTGSFESLQDDTTKYDESRSKSSPKGKVPTIKSKKFNDPERRHEFIMEAAKGIAAADAFAVDLGVELPGQEPAQWFMTMAFANSEVDEKSRGMAYWRFTDNRSTGPVELESCIGLEGRGPRSYMSLGNEKHASPSRSIDIDLRIGKTCEKGFRMQIHGKQEQTDEYRVLLNKLPVMMKCMKEMKKGMKTTAVCQDASVKAATMDKSRLTIKLDPSVHDTHEIVAEQLRDYIAFLPNVQRKNVHEDSSDKDTVTFSMDLVQPENNANFEIQSFGERLTAKNVNIGPLADLATNSHPDFSARERLDPSDEDSSQDPKCVVSSDSATTFDEKTYPIHLGKCWHVAMTTYPKKNKHQKTPEPIDEEMRVSVVVRDSMDDKKDVKIVLGKDELKLTMDSSRVIVDLNKKILDLDEKRSYRQKNHEGDLDFEVLQRADGSIKLSSDKYDIDVSYDGERVEIEASDKYRSDVRGLCGNYDGEPDNDFTSPRNCVLSKPEQFAASYAMTSSECQGPALENWKKASEADCIHETIRPGNVVSDREAGRSKSGKSTWGYHKKSSEFEKDSRRKWNCISKRTKVIEEADQICFSLRPVPVCTSGCTAVNTKLKVMPFHCMPKGDAAQQIVNRIEQGANPDFSQKPVSKKTSFDMPVHCQAA